jgi:hypothetical protein
VPFLFQLFQSILCLPGKSTLLTGSRFPPGEQRQQSYGKEANGNDNHPGGIAGSSHWLATFGAGNDHVISPQGKSWNSQWIRIVPQAIVPSARDPLCIHADEVELSIATGRAIS